MTGKGCLFIIGAGPGDPGLITVKGLECLKRADVVVYDYLVGEALLRHVRKDARLIYVGKKGGHHTVSQDELNRILVREASTGAVVARLKGGDPFIFGRGGEEAEVLAGAGIPFEVIPGVTSAIAVPAYAGIPLTHREFTSTVAFVTGHEDPEKSESRIDWDKLATIETLVFLMGVKNLSQIADNLMWRGRDPETPAALVRWGTTPDQETLVGTLGNIARRADAAGMTPPAILVVGEVVGLRDRLNWFETKPLFGKGVLITRPEEQSGELVELLSRAGARVISFPTIGIVPPENYDALDRSIEHIEEYQWIIFTSANGVRSFLLRLMEKGGDVRDLKGIRFCAIGPATARMLEERGISVDAVPGEYLSEGVVEVLKTYDMKGTRVLLPRAERARDVIPEGLAGMGATVDVVTAYRTVSSGRDGAELAGLLEEGRIDVITFTSPSTVKHFMEILGNVSVLPGSTRIACIGPVTKSAAEKAGLTVDIMQGPYVIEGLVEAMVRYFEKGD
ncbi:MAG: uroporphyrinogen-III C-methyltransferase [Deltaproteobacteria bacterium]|nr:uroporphyrinogen-III C-methyltransferase [Deltaproteobacteria bacterium]